MWALTPADFSPLFIGDTRSTTQVERLVLCMKKYFSPLFIGDTRSTLYQLDALKREDISVPSSSGTRVQQQSRQPESGARPV